MIRNHQLPFLKRILGSFKALDCVFSLAALKHTEI